MKKFFGVIVAMMLCVCLLASSAMAADSSLVGAIEEAAKNGLPLEDIESIASDFGLDLAELDLEGLIASFDDDSIDPEEIQNVLQDMNSVQAPNSGNGSAGAAGFDLAALVGLIPVDEEISNILVSVVSALSDGGLESLMSSIASTFGNQGISLTSYNEVGSFDISSVSGVAAGTTTVLSTIADTLFGALESLGLSTETIEGVLDNDIVNFFANMYIGFIGEVEETTVPAVVTTKPPKTGDTSAVIVALATLTAASGAAFVCLKKKED